MRISDWSSDVCSSDLNYTHVARALVDHGVNCIVQKVAANAEGTQLSLSSNPDLPFDAVDAIVAAGLPRPLLVAEIDPLLPWLGGTAAVPLDFFRSEERRVGKAGVSTGRARWAPDKEK